jgi:topoisomerase IV subunit A
LRQLARLEGIRIEQELATKRKEEAGLQELIEKPAVLRRLMIKEIETDAKQYGDSRRTFIEVADRAVLEVKVVDEPVTVIVSEKGWVRSRQGHGHDASQFTFKSGDSLYGSFECRSTDALIVLGSNGRVYSVPVANLPAARGDGNPVTAMIDLEAGARVCHVLAGSTDQTWVFTTAVGMGLRAPVSALISRQKAGKQFFTLDATDVLLRPVPILPGTTHLALMSARDRLAVIEIGEVKQLTGGGRGTVLLAVEAPDTLAQVCPVTPAGLSVTGVYRNLPRNEVLVGTALTPYLSKRARKGKVLQTKLKNPVLGPVLG